MVSEGKFERVRVVFWQSRGGDGEDSIEREAGGAGGFGGGEGAGVGGEAAEVGGHGGLDARCGWMWWRVDLVGWVGSLLD